MTDDKIKRPDCEETIPKGYVHPRTGQSFQWVNPDPKERPEVVRISANGSVL